MTFLRTLFCIILFASHAGAQLTWSLASGNESWPADKRAAIVTAMNEAVALYNANGYFPKTLWANYNASVPTAQASYSGWIDFGGQIGTRTALHEISHALGVGQVAAWNTNRSGNIWTGTFATNRVKLFDGPSATLSADSMHFWPYGLNFASEDSTTNRVRHIKMVSAMRRDMGIVVDSDNDGIPDDWEMFHFGGLGQTASGNFDMDGDNNLAEYNADTNPAQTFTFQWTGGTGPWDTTSARWTGAATFWRNGGNDAAVFSGTAGTVTLAAGITANNLTFSTNGYQISGTTMTLTGQSPSITVATGITTTVNPVISGSNGLDKRGTGNLVLTGDSTYSGPTTVSAGTLTLDPGARLYMSGGSTGLEIQAGATLSFEGNWGWDGTLRYHGVQAAETLIDGGTLRHTGPSNAATSGGAGRLFTVGTAGATLDSATAGAEFRIGYRYDYSTSLTSLGGTLILTGAGNGDLSYILPGSGGLVKNGSGRWSLRQPNTYSGTTTVNAGTLAILDTFTSPSCSIASAAVLELNTSSGSKDYRTVSFSGAGTLRKTGANTAAWGAAASTFSMASGSLIDVTAGTFTGGSSANEVWTNNRSDLNVAATASFVGAEANVRVDALTGAGTISSGSTDASYASFTFGVDNGDGSFTGVLADGTAPGDFSKTGSGTQTLSGINTFTGSLTIDAGALRITRAEALGAGPRTITMNNGTNGLCRLILAGGSTNISLPSTVSFLTSNQNTTFPAIVNESGHNSIAGNFTLTNGGGSTRVRVDGGSLTLSGNFTPNVTGRALNLDGSANGTLSGRLLNGTGSNTASLAKDGTGTWTVTGTAHTFTGPTSVNAGTLLVNGRLNTTSSITVASGATIGGTGTLGATSIQSGGTLRPGGETAGTLSTGALTCDAGSIAIFEIGATSDRLNVTGNLTLNAHLDVTNPSGMVGTFKLITYTGTLSGAGLSLRNLPQGFKYTVNTSVPGEISLIVTPSTFTNWINSFPALTASQKAASADPDNDGESNLAEYAFAGNPTDPGSRGRILLQLLDTREDNSNTQDLTLTAEIRAEATLTPDGPDLVASIDGITYRFEGSTDLSTFSSPISEVIPHRGPDSAKPGYTFKTIRLNASNGLPGKGFLRASASQP